MRGNGSGRNLGPNARALLGEPSQEELVRFAQQQAMAAPPAMILLGGQIAVLHGVDQEGNEVTTVRIKTPLAQSDVALRPEGVAELITLLQGQVPGPKIDVVHSLDGLES